MAAFLYLLIAMFPQGHPAGSASYWKRGKRSYYDYPIDKEVGDTALEAYEAKQAKIRQLLQQIENGLESTTAERPA